MPRARAVSELFSCWMTIDAVSARLWSKFSSGLVSEFGCVGVRRLRPAGQRRRQHEDADRLVLDGNGGVRRPRPAPSVTKNAGTVMYQRRKRTITVRQKSIGLLTQQSRWKSSALTVAAHW